MQKTFSFAFDFTDHGCLLYTINVLLCRGEGAVKMLASLNKSHHVNLLHIINVLLCSGGLSLYYQRIVLKGQAGRKTLSMYCFVGEAEAVKESCSFSCTKNVNLLVGINILFCRGRGP